MHFEKKRKYSNLNIFGMENFLKRKIKSLKTQKLRLFPNPLMKLHEISYLSILSVYLFLGLGKNTKIEKLSDFFVN